MRLLAPVPHGHWKTTTLVAGLRTSGITAPYVLDGAVNGVIFRAYVEQVLAPTLNAGDILILDNLPSHKVAGVRETVEARGAQVLYLPPYSPDLNPIEQALSPSTSFRKHSPRRWNPTGRSQPLCNGPSAILGGAKP